MKRIKLSRMIVSALLVVVLIFGSKTVYSSASGTTDIEDVRITGYRTAGDDIFVYISGMSSASKEDISVQIGTERNVEFEVVNAEDVRIRTLMILDNSHSTRDHWGKGAPALKLMDDLVDAHRNGEEFSLITYSTQREKLIDYTDDTAAVKQVIDSVEFANQESYLINTRYEELKKTADAGDGCYYRIILIGDGVQDTERTYQESEMENLLKRAGIPVYSVAVDTSKGYNDNSKEIGMMESYSRTSRARSWVVSGEDSHDQIVRDLVTDGNMICLKITPPWDMRTGGIYSGEMKIVFQGASSTLRLEGFTMPMASGDAPAEPTAEPTKAEATPTPTEEPTPTPAPVEEEEEDDEEEPEEEESSWIQDNLILVIIAGSVLAAALIAGAVALIIKKKRDEDEKNKWRYLPENSMPPAASAVPVQQMPGSAQDDRTAFLWEPGQAQAQSRIVLTETDAPGRVFGCATAESIVIGRKLPADIVLDHDKAVSARHCMISRRNGEYYLMDLGSANGTYYNGKEVSGEQKIESGGILTLGRGKYRFSTEA